MGTGTAPPGPSPSNSTLCYFVTSQQPGCARCSISLRFRCPYTRTLVIARPHSLVFVHPQSSECGHSAGAPAGDFRQTTLLEERDVDMEENDGRDGSASLAGSPAPDRRPRRRSEDVPEESRSAQDFSASWTSGETFNPITLPLYADVFCMAAFPRVSRISRSDSSVCRVNGGGSKASAESAELEDLLVLTDRQILLLLRYDEEKQTVVTVESIDLKEVSTRFVDGGPLMAVCPTTRCIVVYQYESLLQYLPFGPAASSSLSPARNHEAGSSLFSGVRLFRLDEQNVLDICFLPPPEVCGPAKSSAAEGAEPSAGSSSALALWGIRGKHGFHGVASGASCPPPLERESEREAGATVTVQSAHLCVLYETVEGQVSAAPGSFHRFQRFIRTVRLPLDDLLFPPRSAAPHLWTSPYLLHPLRVKSCSSRLFAPAFAPRAASEVGRSRRQGERVSEGGDAEGLAPCLLVLGAEEILYLRFPHCASLPSVLLSDLSSLSLTFDGSIPGPLVLRHRGLPSGLQEIVAVEQVREVDAEAAEVKHRKVFLLGDVSGQIYMLMLFENSRPRPQMEIEQRLTGASSRESPRPSGEEASGRAARMCVEWLGQASEPTGLSYLGNGILFVASATSDSLLLRILDVGRSVEGLQRLFSENAARRLEADAHLSLEQPPHAQKGREEGAEGHAGNHAGKDTEHNWERCEERSEEDGDALGRNNSRNAVRDLGAEGTLQLAQRKARRRDMEERPSESTKGMDVSGRLQLLQVFPNLGPIVDCCLAEVEGLDQRLLIVACGHGRSTSLRFIRSGLALHASCASVALHAPVHRLWTLDLSPYAIAASASGMRISGRQSHSRGEFSKTRADALLARGPIAVLAFPHETRVLAWTLKPRGDRSNPKGGERRNRKESEGEGGRARDRKKRRGKRKEKKDGRRAEEREKEKKRRARQKKRGRGKKARKRKRERRACIDLKILFFSLHSAADISSMDVEMEEHGGVSSRGRFERRRGREEGEPDSEGSEAVLDEICEPLLSSEFHEQNDSLKESSFGFKRDETTILATALRLPGGWRRRTVEKKDLVAHPAACAETTCACSLGLVQVLPSAVRVVDPVSLSLLKEFPLFSGFSPALPSSQKIHFAALVASPCSGARGGSGDSLALALSDGSVACLELLGNLHAEALPDASQLRREEREQVRETPTSLSEAAAGEEPDCGAGVHLRMLNVKKVCDEIAAFHAVGLSALALVSESREENEETETLLSCEGDEGLAAVGDFDLGKVRLLALPSLLELASFDAYGDELGVRITSLLLCTLENTSWVLAGLSDGRLVSHALEVSRRPLSPPSHSPRFSVRLSHRKVVHMGSEPLRLSPLVEKRDMLRMQQRQRRRACARNDAAATARDETGNCKGEKEACLCWS
ncbi:CPSF A subunit region protein, partial [Toxoplasma gondii RUB]